jgi:hypothetical protein
MNPYAAYLVRPWTRVNGRGWGERFAQNPVFSQELLSPDKNRYRT